MHAGALVGWRWYGVFGLGAAVAALAAAPRDPAGTPAAASGAEVRVGIAQGDLRGDDDRVLQAAVDYVARLGGGTVHVGPGRYRVRNALALRDNVRVLGVPGKTVLVACDGFKTRLAVDGDCNEQQITVEDPSGLRVGDGVAIQDERHPGGFEVTTATLTARLDRNTFRISTPLYVDYMVSLKASARLAFPVVAGWGIKGAAVEGLTVEGKGAHAGGIDGCRAGGIYLFRCEEVAIRNCAVRAYNGDGISFQVSRRVTVENCLCEGNAGLGLHPGSGSQRPVLRRNRSLNNGGDGLFVCWRLPAEAFGTLEVHAYQMLSSGEIIRDSRVVYVQPRDDLKIKVQPDKDIHRPGEEGRMQFQVTDAEGKPTAAALGILVVDEAVYALQDMQEWRPAAFPAERVALAVQPEGCLVPARRVLGDLLQRKPVDLKASRQHASQIPVGHLRAAEQLDDPDRPFARHRPHELLGSIGNVPAR